MDKIDQNAQDMVDILGDITSGKTNDDSKRKTLKLPAQGAFLSIIRDAKNIIDINGPRGTFGSKETKNAR